MIAQYPNDKGTYTLILKLDSPARLTIGKRGTFNFPAGWYTYVGSAFGAGGLRGRLKHHLKPVRKPHWHIDYLRVVATVQDVWWIASETRYEHKWAQKLQSLPYATIPAPRFGASDCTCAAHLFHFVELPNTAAVDYERLQMPDNTKSMLLIPQHQFINSEQD